MTTWVPIFDATGSQFPTDPQACWDDGFRAIAGYVNQGSWKSFTATLRAKWLTSAHPFGFAPMYEVTGTEPATNPQVGSAHALAARKGARALGVPDTAAIAYAMDTNVSMAQVKGPIAKYFELVGRYDTCLPIAYIENDGTDWLKAQGLIAGGFIPAAYSWNNPPVLITPANASAAALWTQEHNGRKVHGGTVDVGNIRTSAPIWWPSNSAGEDMPISQDDVHTIATTAALPATNPTRSIGTVLLGLESGLAALQAKVDALPTTAAPAAPLSIADVARIAKAVLDEQHRRDES